MFDTSLWSEKNNERNLQNERSSMEFLFLRELVTWYNHRNSSRHIFLQPINAPFRVDARKRHAVQTMKTRRRGWPRTNRCRVQWRFDKRKTGRSFSLHRGASVALFNSPPFPAGILTKATCSGGHCYSDRSRREKGEKKERNVLTFDSHVMRKSTDGVLPA